MPVAGSIISASARGPHSSIITGLLAIARRKVPGQSIVMTSLCLYASIADVIITESLRTVGAYTFFFLYVGDFSAYSPYQLSCLNLSTALLDEVA